MTAHPKIAMPTGHHRSTSRSTLESLRSPYSAGTVSG